jgi:hypothetical protein
MSISPGIELELMMIFTLQPSTTATASGEVTAELIAKAIKLAFVSQLSKGPQKSIPRDITIKSFGLFPIDIVYGQESGCLF